MILTEDCAVDKQGKFVGAKPDEVLVCFAVGGVGGHENHFIVNVDNAVGPRSVVGEHLQILVAEVWVLGVCLDDTRGHTADFAELAPAALGKPLEQNVWHGLVEEAEAFAPELEDVGAEFAQLAIGYAGGVGGVDEDKAIARVDVSAVDDGDAQGVGVVGMRVEFRKGVAVKLGIEDGIDEAAGCRHVFENLGCLVVGVASFVHQGKLGAQHLGLAQLHL